MLGKLRGTRVETLVMTALIAIVVSLASLLVAQRTFGAGEGVPYSVPFVVAYQGRLTDPTSGQIKPDGAYNLTFKIYDAVSGGSLLWSEVHGGANNVTVKNGLF